MVTAPRPARESRRSVPRGFPTLPFNSRRSRPSPAYNKRHRLLDGFPRLVRLILPSPSRAGKFRSFSRAFCSAFKVPLQAFHFKVDYAFSVALDGEEFFGYA